MITNYYCNPPLKKTLWLLNGFRLIFPVFLGFRVGVAGHGRRLQHWSEGGGYFLVAGMPCGKAIPPVSKHSHSYGTCRLKIRSDFKWLSIAMLVCLPESNHIWILMLLLDGSQPVSFRRNKMKMPSWKKATRRDPPCKGDLQIIHFFHGIFRIFHEINHLFWGTPTTGNSHILLETDSIGFVECCMWLSDGRPWSLPRARRRMGSRSSAKKGRCALQNVGFT